MLYYDYNWGCCLYQRPKLQHMICLTFGSFLALACGITEMYLRIEMDPTDRSSH